LKEDVADEIHLPYFGLRFLYRGETILSQLTKSGITF
jgi:hypothetical protein